MHTHTHTHAHTQRKCARARTVHCPRITSPGTALPAADIVHGHSRFRCCCAIQRLRASRPRHTGTRRRWKRSAHSTRSSCSAQPTSTSRKHARLWLRSIRTSGPLCPALASRHVALMSLCVATVSAGPRRTGNGNGTASSCACVRACVCSGVQSTNTKSTPDIPAYTGGLPPIFLLVPGGYPRYSCFRRAPCG